MATEIKIKGGTYLQVRRHGSLISPLSTPAGQPVLHPPGAALQYAVNEGTPAVASRELLLLA